MSGINWELIFLIFFFLCNLCGHPVDMNFKLCFLITLFGHQVVDARAGPGTKSLTKFKAKNKKKKLKAEGSKKLESVKKKHVYVKSADRDRSPTTFSDGGMF